ncbi:hypothetical protein FKM82_015059 [Ascaphus truei]
MRRGGVRSSALARAQAQLLGQRIAIKPKDSTDELKEYMNALNKKTSALKLSQPSAPSLSDRSDFSVEDQATERHKGTESPRQAAFTQSRFLKNKQNSEQKPESLRSGAATANVMGPAARVNPAARPKVPTSAALRKLAEIENRYGHRRLEMDTSENESDLRTSDERPFSARSSSDRSRRGVRFLRKKADVKDSEAKIQKVGRAGQSKPTERRRVTLESEEEEILKLIGSSVEMSEDSDRWWNLPKKPPRTPSPPSKGTPRRNLQRSHSALGYSSLRRPSSRYHSRTPSPPSRSTARSPGRTHSLTRLGSRSPSPSVRSTLTNNTSPRARLGRRSRTPLSQRSDLKSLDELFSRTAETDDPSSASSNDFKLNILNLDELAPTTETSEVRGKEAAAIKTPKEIHPPSPTQGKALPHTKHIKPFTRKISLTEEETASEVQTEMNASTEISVLTQEESADNTAYSEDFENSSEATASETEHRSRSVSRSSLKCAPSTECTPSPIRSYSRPKKPQRGKRWAETVQRVSMKEMAVQTSEPGFTYYWPHAASTLGPSLAPAFVDPVPIAHHVVSPELIEALTTYSPAALALNDMLKQQLFLTQSFVELTRQFHLSTVRSLEGEDYHYTTLEETKEYIRHHQSLKRKHGVALGTNGHHSWH